MKRHVIKICLAVLVVVSILLGLLVALTRDWGPGMSFGFLSGRVLAVPANKNAGRAFYSTTQEMYSFEADFSDFCAKADAELSPMGFKIAPVASLADREYRLGDYVSANRWIVVRIYEDIEFTQLHDGLWHRPAEGWVSVEVRRSRLRSWPPKNLLVRLQLMARRFANKSPAQNKNSGAGNEQENR